MAITFAAGAFSSTSTQASLIAKDLFENLSWKIALVNLGKASLLLQGGILVAPIFVFQTPPERGKPYWTIGIVQYHSIQGNLAYCRANAWAFMSTESMLGKDITQQELYVDPWSENGGTRAQGFRIKFDYTPLNAHRKAMAGIAGGPLSLVEDQRLRRRGQADELKKLVGGMYGLIEEGQIRDDYPKVHVGKLLDDISDTYTLESELKKLLGED